jgi:hypothetical protein
MLWKILQILELIYEAVRPRLSATLKLKVKGKHMATILVGGTGTAVFQEWSGPSGTGDMLPPAGAVTFSSDNTSVATVDPNSGIVTGLALGTANISGVDAANNLTASTPVSVTEVAQSATIVVTANAVIPSSARKK